MSYSVLVVEDSKIVRSVIVKTLKLCCPEIATIHEAENGQLGLDLMDKNWVDMVFADINMPVMDGVEMITRMRDSGLLKATPVVVISTEGSETRIKQLLDMGVREFLRKPFTPEQLRDVLDKYLGGNHAHV